MSFRPVNPSSPPEPDLDDSPGGGPPAARGPPANEQQPLKKPRRLRAQRVRADALQLGHLTARGSHSALGTIEGRVADLSLHGMAVVLPPTELTLLVGDLLERFCLESNGQLIFEGTVVVRYVSETESSVTVGVELQSSQLDLSEVYRLSERRTFAERLRAVSEPVNDGVSAGFKAWVVELRTHLDTLREFMDREERTHRSLDLATRSEIMSQYLAEATPLLITYMNAASAELANQVRDLAPEAHSAHRAFFRKHLLPVLSASPLLQRAYEKPLGYAGDYEMMNMLYRNHAEGDSLFAKALNSYAAQEPAARANINRLDYLGVQIARIIAASPSPRVRIASIGCGPGREIAQLLERSPELGSRLDVALIDQEDRVISYLQRTLGPIAARTGTRLQLIKESVRRLLSQKRLSLALGARDFVYSAGLFDYLNDRSFQGLLSALYETLNPGGLLAVGNVAAVNPTRWFMEYCLDWFLIHRSPEELSAFAAGLQPAPSSVRVDSEPLGVNLFLLVQK